MIVEQAVPVVVGIGAVEGDVRSPLRRFALGSAGLVASALAARRPGVGPREVTAFRAINDLPEAWVVPVWLVMQGGTLGAVPVSAGVAWVAGRPELARHLLLSGGSAWVLAKVVKHAVGRPRPAALIAGTHSRGRAATGLGYVSGHAAVASALAAALLPTAGPHGRRALLVTAPIVGLARMYVGAHLPLDVIGGATLGIAVEAIAAYVADRALPPDPTRVSRRLSPSSLRRLPRSGGG